LSMSASMDWRMASARPMDLLAASRLIALVMTDELHGRARVHLQMRDEKGASLGKCNGAVIGP
jgi:hypothetical protein